MKLKWGLIFIIKVLIMENAISQIPKGFVLINEKCPSIIFQMDYSTENNFTGSVVSGYKTAKAYMIQDAAIALCKVQNEALSLGYTLKIFDAYRPKKAVAAFGEWAKLPEDNPELKKIFYPKFSRQELFDTGYIAKQSSHSRGSAVDLTLVNLKTNKDLDMGTRFDYFDNSSHTDSENVSLKQKENRIFLKDLMERFGFTNYSQEWWHYSFRPELYPTTYFDFDIE